jgi:hypothetical protein
MKLGKLNKVFLVTILVFVIVNFLPTTLFAQSGVQANVDSSLAVGAAKAIGKGVDAFGTFLPFDDIFYSVAKPLIAIARTIIGVVLGIVGAIYDFVIEITVRNAQVTYENVFKDPVTQLWKIFRDIGNILIIFSLLYLAIRTIIQGDGFADKKALAGVLLAAVFINFSLFFTNTVFGISNYVANSFYGQIGGSETVSNSGASFIYDMVKSFNIVPQQEATAGGSGFFQSPIIKATIDPIGTVSDVVLKKISNPNKIDDLGKDFLFLGMLATVSLCLIIIFLVSALVLLWRFLVFMFLMITSAIGLVGYFIPFLKPYFNMWWQQLVKQSVALPVFMLTFYIAYFFIRSHFSGLMAADFSQIFDGNFSAVIQVWVYFFFSIGFLLLTIFLPFSISESAAGVTPKITNKLKGYGRKSIDWAKKRGGQAAGGATAGLVARGLRATVGKKGRMVLQDKDLKARAASGDKGAMRKLKIADYLGNKATYDGRNIKVGGKTLGEQTGLGKGIDGYKTMVDSQQKKLEEKKKREMELTGLKGKKGSVVEIMEAKETIKEHEDKMKSDVKDYKNIVSTKGKDSPEAKQARKDIEDFDKDYLQEARKELGRLNNLGEAEYADIMNSRAEKYWNSAKKMASEKIVKNSTKKWTEAADKKAMEQLTKMLGENKDKN